MSSRYTKNQIIVSFLFVGGFFLLFYILTPTIEEHRCNKLQSPYYHSINGVVTNKFIDSKNHAYPIIKIRNFEKTTSTADEMNLLFDVSGFFDLVQIGDTIRNDQWSIAFKINSDTTVTLDYGADCTGKLTGGK